MPNFDAYLSKSVDSIEAPKALPVGHYFASVSSQQFTSGGNNTQGYELVEAKNEAKTPMVRIHFELSSADADVNAADLPENGVQGRKLNTNFILNSDVGQSNLRKMLEDGLQLPVHGISLGDALQQIAGQPCRLYIEQRQDPRDPSVFYPDVKKVLAA